MKRITLVAVLLACGFLAASVPASAQEPTPAPSANWFSGQASILLLGRDNVDSSKFEEYRLVPKGLSMPVFTLQGSQDGNDYALFGQNVSKDDQRYRGWANIGWIGMSFDYNQIPHNMGNDGRTLHAESAEGQWRMSGTLRKALGDAVDAVPTTARTYPFYVGLLTPSIDAATIVDISSLRKRGEYGFDFGRKLPFDLKVTYLHEIKDGARGASAGDILGVVSPVVDVPEPLNEVTQDFGIRWAYPFKKGDVHASFNRNIFNSRVDALIVDNPFRATDLAYVSTSVPGGPAQARFSTAPDNEASRGAFGFQLKFPRQTRIAGDVAYGSWTQNAAFLPYTINSAIFTPAGAPANALSTLQEPSLNGKINTASYNFSFGSRPIEGLRVRMHYRNYEYKDKTDRWVITGDTSGAPDRSWTAANPPTEEEPYGHATANRTDASTGRFEALAAFDIKDLTLEATYRNIQTSWEGRANSSGTDGSENGYTLSAIYRTSDWLDLRFTFDQADRTVDGFSPTSTAALQGVMADHAEREQTRVGLNAELMPWETFGMTFAYYRRNDDYPNRPFEVPGNPETQSGLLETSYDEFSVDFNFTPNARAELTAFYTYERVEETNQWVTLTSGAVNNILRYAPWDKGNTFGVNGLFRLVPEKWTFSLTAQYQKVDGFLDITAREAGSFYTPGRTTLIPPGQGGAADISDYDDTKQTTVIADLAYALGKAWALSVGYAYDKYSFADAFSDGTTIFPQSVLFFMKANDGGYTVNAGYTRLTYRF